VRQFYWLLFGTVLLKGTLAILVPITSDEAYVALWGKYLGASYYGHPPLAGWLQGLVRLGGNHPLAVRLPAVVLSSLAAAILFHYVHRRSPERALPVAAAYLFLPFTLVAGVIFSLDSFLLPAFVAGTVFFAQGVETGRVRSFVVAGLIIGLALLTKYFAGLLVIGLVLGALIHHRRRQLAPGLVVFIAVAGVLFLVNLVWNYYHCWSNFLYNFVNRHVDAGFNPTTPLAYVGTIAWGFSPALVYYLVRYRPRTPPEGTSRTFLYACLVPLLLLFTISLWRSVGLHWILGFIALGYVVAGLALPLDSWWRIARFNVVFGGLHILLIVGVFVFRQQSAVLSWTDYKLYVAATRGDVMKSMLDPLVDNYVIATPSHASASLLEFTTDHPVTVLGKGGFHSRQHDIWTDVRDLDGRDIFVLIHHRGEIKDYPPYFSHVELDSLVVDKTKFFMIRGHGFNYESYRAGVLTRINEDFYQIPRWLPVGACYFHARYGLW
jgi:4-amino-4-deoxy-L-arabinose transferase-like glycosyltransferase